MNAHAGQARRNRGFSSVVDDFWIGGYGLVIQGWSRQRIEIFRDASSRGIAD